MINNNIEEINKILIKKVEEEYKLAKEAKYNSEDPDEIIPSYFCSSIIERVSLLLNYQGLPELLKKHWSKNLKIEDLCFEICQDLLKDPSLISVNPENKKELAEKAIRISTAILTEGTVSAPIEGITGLEIRKRKDYEIKGPIIGEYFELRFSGPIRGSGATAQVLSVMVAEFLRKKMNFGVYDALEEEISRTVIEVQKYNKLHPLQKEIIAKNVEIAVKNCPICISGEATELQEVDSFKYLERIPSPRIRGGMVLVLQEGIIGRANKVAAYNEKLKMDWNWIYDIINNQKMMEKKENKDLEFEEIEEEEIPGYKKKMILGRPLLSEAKRGGFRVRIGRTRTSGNCAIGMNPLTIKLLKFINIGSQLRIEFPGKSAIISICDELEPAMVYYIDKEGLSHQKRVSEKILKEENILKITDLGEVLIAAGEFLEQNKDLPKIGYNLDVWKTRLKNISSSLVNDFSKVLAQENSILKKTKLLSFYEEGFPVLPQHCFLKSLRLLDKQLLVKLNKPEVDITDEKILKILIDYHIPFYPVSSTSVVIESPLLSKFLEGGLYELEPCYYGCRTGRSEASKPCSLKPFANSLTFYNTESQKRGLGSTIRKNLTADATTYTCRDNTCSSYDQLTLYYKCKSCGKRTVETYYHFYDDTSEKLTQERYDELSEQEKKSYHSTKRINYDFLNSSKVLNILKKERVLIDDVKGLVEPQTTYLEPIEKGIYRTKHNLTTFKDGTCRYDMTDMVCTHFYPYEIGLTIEKVKELGYVRNYKGEQISSIYDLITLHPQDLIVSEDCLEYLFNITKYLDDLLVNYYEKPSYYNLKDKSELIGHLVLGIAPHICTATVGRIIGSVKVRGLYAHPFYTSAKRRNCDGDEDSIFLLLDSFLNYSLKYIPKRRGRLMNIPHLINKVINPTEMDKEVYNMDNSSFSDYPYEKMNCSSLSVKETSESIQTYSKFKKQVVSEVFSHKCKDLSMGTLQNYYLDINTTEEKLEEVLKLTEQINCVPSITLIERLLSCHLLPDLIGNTRTYLNQKKKCKNCKRKYLRVTFSGNCVDCNKPLTTTVYFNMVIKYLEKIKEFKNKYQNQLPLYLLEKIELAIQDVEMIRSLKQS